MKMQQTTLKIENKLVESVRCSAGRGVTTKTECLACALRLDNACGFDYAVLKAMYNDKQRFGIHVTDLTGCLRRSYYDKTIGALEYPHQNIARFLGTSVHKALELKDEHLTSEMHLEGFNVVGTADVVYKNGRIVDYKTTRWLVPAKLPYGSHVTQINIYAAMLRAQGHPVTSAAIQYIDLSGATKCRACSIPYEPNVGGYAACPQCANRVPTAHLGAMLVEVPLEDNPTVVDWINLREKMLTLSLETSTLPDPEVGFLCNYCAFKTQCQEAQ
jgi:CRISPR/Cas system-associated exonuclease Cas4 (RecB family)